VATDTRAGAPELPDLPEPPGELRAPLDSSALFRERPEPVAVVPEAEPATPDAAKPDAVTPDAEADTPAAGAATRAAEEEARTPPGAAEGGGEGDAGSTEQEESLRELFWGED